MAKKLKQPTIYHRLSEFVERAADAVGGYKQLEEEIGKLAKDDTLEPIDRRKLKRIADGDLETVVSFKELNALNAYLLHLGRGGLASMLRAPSLLEAIAIEKHVTFFLGFKPAPQVRRTQQQTLISHWDLRSVTELLQGLYHHAPAGLHFEFQEVPLLLQALTAGDAKPGLTGAESLPELVGQAQWYKSVDRRESGALIAIGSPKACHASEVMLARMFGVDEFGLGGQNAKKVKLPFRFEWAPDQLEKTPSSFAYPFAGSLPPGHWSSDFTSFALEVLDERLAIDLNNASNWVDYGVIVMQRRASGHLWVVCAGLSGPATCAAARLARTLPNDLPLGNPRVHSPVMISVVEADVVRPTPVNRPDDDERGGDEQGGDAREGDAREGDEREIVNQRLRGEPIEWHAG